MRRLFITICLLALVTPAAFSQTNENWNDIIVPQNTVFGVHFVIKPGATFGGILYKERVEIDPQVESEFDNEVRRCIKAANSYFRDDAATGAYTFHFSPEYKEKPYLVIFYIKSVSEYGYTIADVKIVTPGFREAVVVNLKGKGGRFGSFSNLMGDGFESLGEELAKRIDNAVWNGRITVTE